VLELVVLLFALPQAGSERKYEEYHKMNYGMLLNAKNRTEQNRQPESTQWLNSLLSSVWPLVNPELFTSLADMLKRMMLIANRRKENFQKHSADIELLYARI
jgi:hypothetical protein